MTVLIGLAVVCPPAGAAARFHSSAKQRVAAAQQAPATNASDPEERGAHIPDPPTKPSRRSDDDPSDVDEPGGGSEGGGGASGGRGTSGSGTASGGGAASGAGSTGTANVAARPALPRTGGSDPLLLLYFGALLVLAGVGIRMYAAD